MQKHTFKTLITDSQHLILSHSHSSSHTLSDSLTSPYKHCPHSATLAFPPFSFSLCLFLLSKSFFSHSKRSAFIAFSYHTVQPLSLSLSLSLFTLSYQTQCWFCTRVSGNAESLINLCTFFYSCFCNLGFHFEHTSNGQECAGFGSHPFGSIWSCIISFYICFSSKWVLSIVCNVCFVSVYELKMLAFIWSEFDVYLFFFFVCVVDAEIINGIFSNAVSFFMKWLWSLKSTTKTGMV